MSKSTERARKAKARILKGGGKALGVTISPEAADALQSIMDGQGLSQREAIEQALLAFVSSNEAGSAPGEASETAKKALHNSIDIFKMCKALEQRVASLEGQQPRRPNAQERQAQRVEANRQSFMTKLAVAVASRGGWDAMDWEAYHREEVLPLDSLVFQRFEFFEDYLKANRAPIERMAEEVKKMDG